MPVYITGISGIRILVQNAVELFTDNKTDEYVKALTEFYERYKSKIDEESSEVYIIKTNRMGEIKLKIRYRLLRYISKNIERWFG